MSYTFVTLDALPSTDPNSIIDVVGVVKDVGTLTNLTSRAGKELTKRDLTLVDESLTSVTCTLWAERAAGVDDSMLDTVVAIKGVRVGDYGGRSLSTLNSSHIEMNPDVPEAHKMTAWWSSAGRDAAVTSISNSVGGAIGGSSGMGNV